MARRGGVQNRNAGEPHYPDGSSYRERLAQDILEDICAGWKDIDTDDLQHFAPNSQVCVCVCEAVQ